MIQFSIETHAGKIILLAESEDYKVALTMNNLYELQTLAVLIEHEVLAQLHKQEHGE